MRNKLAIFGVDGGTLLLVKMWLDELPNFNRIMENGTYGEMFSSVPPLTCPAWACMFTGKNPGKLGMFDFLTNEKTPKVVDSNNYHTDSLWHLLNVGGVSTGLLNVPITYPPHVIDGYMVCGLGTPETMGTQYTTPLWLRDELNRLVGGYQIIPRVLLALKNQERKCLKSVLEVLEKRVKVAHHLLDKYPSDLFICVFFATDVVQHYFWRYMDTTHPSYAKSAYEGVIKDVYRRVDKAIGEISSRFDNVMVVSDHGFGACHTHFGLNAWLEEAGYLRFKGSAVRDRGFAFGLRDLILKYTTPQFVGWGLRLLPRSWADRLNTNGESMSEILSFYDKVDWENTRAYALGTATGGIFVRDRETKEKIISKLGWYGFRIFKKEEVIDGEYADMAPDLFLELGSNGCYPRAYGGSVWQETAISGSHTQKGLFMACGKDVKRSGEVKEVRIYDVTPTVLRMFNTPVPLDMDGRILKEVV